MRGDLAPIPHGQVNDSAQTLPSVGCDYFAPALLAAKERKIRKDGFVIMDEWDGRMPILGSVAM